MNAPNCYYTSKLAPIIIFQRMKESNSKLCYSKSPDLIDLPLMKEVYGVNAVLTCIEFKDQEELIYSRCRQSGVNHFQINLNPKEISKKSNLNEFALEITEVYQRLMKENLTLLVNCAGGSMKISIILYCLFRLNGRNKDKARSLVSKLREEKKNNFGDLRYEITEKYIIPLLFKLLNRNKE